MKWMVVAGAVAAFAWGGTALAADAPANSAWIDKIAGRTLTAVDGSTIAFTPGEATLTRRITAPDGSVQQDVFTFLNDKLGTVTDGGNGGDAVAVFRADAGGIDARFADGHSEKLMANDGGGVSMSVVLPNGSAKCVAWYPDGHKFTEAEREAAVAAYASRLGVSFPDKPAPGGNGACAPAAPEKTAAVDSPPPAAPAPKLSPRLAKLAKLHAIASFMPAAATAADAAPAVTTPKGIAVVAVRDSVVHPIDASADAKSADPKDAGASSCLSVDSDGAHWGFRNACDYPVQFVYCLRGGGDALAACENGSVPGGVSAKGFAALLPDKTLSESDAQHDFRWVGCGGGAGEVVPYLDRTNPPVGRCVHGSAT